MPIHVNVPREQFSTVAYAAPKAVNWNLLLPRGHNNVAIHDHSASHTRSSGVVDFRTRADNMGLYNAKVTAVDTEYTICDISGAGQLQQVVGPYNNAATNYTFNVTLDGVTKQFTYTSPAAACVPVLGVFGDYRYWVYNYVSAVGPDHPYIYLTLNICHPRVLLTQGNMKEWPVYFSSQCKITIQADALYSTTSETAYAYAGVLLDT